MKITRRQFLTKSLMTTCSMILFSVFRLPKTIQASDTFDLLVIKGGDPAKRIEAMFEAFGGAKNLIPKNANILLKPNASFARTPKQAANVNPETIFTITKTIKTETNPKQIIAFDYTSDPAAISFEKSGIQEAIEKAGGKLYSAEEKSHYTNVIVEKSQKLKSQLINKDIAKSDFFINIAIPKHHSITTITAGIKNLMGCIFNRHSYHMNNLDLCIAELATTIKPDLNIIDAQNILLTRGPHGPGKVRTLKTTIVSKDILLADAYAATLFKKEAKNIPHMQLAYKLGVGEIDLTKAKIKVITI